MDGSQVAVVAEAGLSARVAGAQDGPSLVLIHGYSLSSAVWRCQLESDLAVDHKLIAIDLPGHGLSAPSPGAIDARDWAARVDRLLDTLVMGSFTAIAWSYGGLVLGDLLAHGKAERISSIGLVAAASALSSDFARSSEDAFFALARDMSSRNPTLRTAATGRFLRMLTSEPLDDEPLKEIQTEAEWVSPEVRAALLARDVDHAATYANFHGAVHVMHGTHDQLMPPSVSHQYLKTLPGSTLDMFPGAGHMPFLEDPLRFNARLRSLARSS